jgi:hypothetical protein
LFMPDLVKGKNLSATAGTGVWTWTDSFHVLALILDSDNIFNLKNQSRLFAILAESAVKSQKSRKTLYLHGHVSKWVNTNDWNVGDSTSSMQELPKYSI